MRNTTTPFLCALLLLSAALFPSSILHAQDYCPPDGFTLGVEPICHLVFADVDHSSPGDPSAPAYEDFTSITAHLEAGQTYTVSASGYSGGTPPDHLAANFDWDGDYTFETHVELADIQGDNCDTMTSASFTVPLTAVPGLSRVRFVKTFSYYADDDGCMWGSNYGQAEDYTVEVGPTSAVHEVRTARLAIYPNPGDGDLTFTNVCNSAELDVRILDVTGRQVHADRLLVPVGGNAQLAYRGVLAAGAYYAVVTGGTVVASAPFVVR